MSDILITGALVIVGIVAVIEVFNAIRTGITGVKAWPVAIRAKCPVWFWTCTAIQGAIGSVCFGLVIWSLFSK